MCIEEVSAVILWLKFNASTVHGSVFGGASFGAVRGVGTAIEFAINRAVMVN